MHLSTSNFLFWSICTARFTILVPSRVSAYRTAVDTAKNVRGSGSGLRIGYTPLVGDFRESELILSFMAANPNIQVFRMIDSRDNLIHMLENDTVDAILLPLMSMKGRDPIRIHDIDQLPGIVWHKVIVNDKVHLGFPASHPLAKVPLITRSMFPRLKDETFLFSTRQADNGGVKQRNHIRELLGIEEENFRTRLIDFAEPTLALRLVEMNKGLLPQSCFVPKRMGDVVFIPVEGWPCEVSLYFIYKENHLRGALRKFEEAVAAFSRKAKQENNTDITEI